MKRAVRYGRGAFALGLMLSINLPALSAEPLAGADIVLTRDPPPPRPSIVIAKSDRSGRFAARITELGSYTISAACASDGCPAHTMTIDASGTELRSEPFDTIRLTVTRPILLRGTIQTQD